MFNVSFNVSNERKECTGIPDRVCDIMYRIFLSRTLQWYFCIASDVKLQLFRLIKKSLILGLFFVPIRVNHAEITA